MTKILVTGSRGWPYPDVVQGALENALKEFPEFTLVHGACPTGADAQAHEAYSAMENRGRIEEHPANWALHGKYAGPLRNRQMVETLNKETDQVIGFNYNDSRGTRGCLKFALEAGLSITEYLLVGDKLSVRRYKRA